MRLVIVALGTWGDVRPNVVLASALQHAGYEVLVISPNEFGAWVQARDLPFAGISVNIQAMISELQLTGDNPLKAMQAMKATMAPAMKGTAREVAAVVREGDVLLMSEGVHALLHGVVDHLSLRVIHIGLQPTAPSREMALINPLRLPGGFPLRGAYNRLTTSVYRRTTWSSFGAQGNLMRAQLPGLKPLTYAEFSARLDSLPSVLLVSRHVLPRPGDWPTHHRITGFLFDDDATWQPPQALADFLAAGDKPVYVGFGSMSDRDVERTTRVVVDAVHQSGQRAVLLSGWAGLGAAGLPDHIHLLKYAPHAWLFPRMAAVVHHGGAGSTAAGLRAGVPSLVTPVGADQPFWGERVYALGVGPRPIRRARLTAAKLAAAITEAVTDRTMQQRAAALGAKIQAEDSVGEAVKAVREILGQG
jgi:UDP:flavonoid glycosyltransferase YjiC (YdhE family)